MNRWLILIPSALALLAIAHLGDFYINFASRILIAAIFALSLNLLVGYAGLMSLGHSAFFGVAGYCMAWLIVTRGWSPVAAIPAALLLTGIAAGLFGLLALRAKGIGFLMITLALGQMAWGLAMRWVSVTGGDNGIRGIARPTPFGVDLTTATAFYALVATVFSLVCLVLYWFTRSPFGASLRGTRDQPRRMSALGFDVTLIRWSAFVAAGCMAGLAGVLDVYFNRFIDPSVLSLQSSAEGLLMVIVGGVDVLLGPVVGAAAVLIFAQVASDYTEHWTAALGILFLVIVVLMPDGLVPGVRRLWTKLRTLQTAPGTLANQLLKRGKAR
jgi:branched-chain amino acid transport system permease protein